GDGPVAHRRLGTWRGGRQGAAACGAGEDAAPGLAPRAGANVLPPVDESRATRVSWRALSLSIAPRSATATGALAACRPAAVWLARCPFERTSNGTPTATATTTAAAAASIGGEKRDTGRAGSAGRVARR